jgi:gamma-glutamyl-gamma-aminobutyrate hydrolase PuuD
MLVEQFLDFPLLEITNSFHHQTVKSLGSRLKGIYYSIDGEVECFIHEKYPIIAVQFHPEMDMENEFYLMFLMYFKNLFSIFKS